MTPTRVNNGVVLIEGNPGVPPLPLGPLDLQITLLDGQ